ncbi:hypothetical protein SBDP1_500048 [Syntrophobacter sp. SbD1]|nr:hypothetical protein SBDP1_500048 [Syntrophobacter sp. SbD1]
MSAHGVYPMTELKKGTVPENGKNQK